MEHLLALNFEDGVTRFACCREGDTVAEAAHRIGITIPLECRGRLRGPGGWRLASGDYQRNTCYEDSLSEAEAAGLLAPACQMRPRTDCVIDIGASSHACKTEAHRFTAVIRALNRVSPSTFVLSLGLTRPTPFLPGQYARILIPGTNQWRSYSFSTAARDARMTFLIRYVARGAMSRFLAERARPGMTLELVGPLGNLYLREVRRPLLFLAGGTGVASCLAMLDELAHRGTNGQPVHLVHAISREVNLVAHQRLLSLAARVPRFSFLLCCSSTSSPVLRRGHVTDFLHPDHLNGGDVDVYVSGPPGMVETTRQWLQAATVRPANVYVEKFS